MTITGEPTPEQYEDDLDDEDAEEEDVDPGLLRDPDGPAA